jgi:hypothetical protein
MKRLRATTSPMPVWSDELDKLCEPHSCRVSALPVVQCFDDPLEVLLDRFAKSVEPEEKVALMAQFVSRSRPSSCGDRRRLLPTSMDFRRLGVANTLN